MKGSILFSFLSAVALCVVTVAQANDDQVLDPASQRYIEMLSNGGPTTIRSTARSMHSTGESNQRVLDVAAEVLLRDYKNDDSATVIDAMAWITKALSNAKTDRYQSVLQEVVENAGHRKLAGYAEDSLNKHLPSGAPYQRGTVDLRKVAKETADNNQASTTQASGSNSDYHPISVVREGMSMQEAFDLAGPPTAKYQHQTGKGFNPFNFAGKDVMRQVALYKGQGRIVFSNVSTYSASWKVIEVILDEHESGYQ